jgi:hypothetical protein
MASFIAIEEIFKPCSRLGFHIPIQDPVPEKKQFFKPLLTQIHQNWA